MPPPAARQSSEMEVPLATASITIERTPCFGFCPAYALTLRGTGEVFYSGKSHVGVVGARRDTMSVDSFVELVNEFERVRFWDALDEYKLHHGAERRGDKIVRFEGDVTDLPTTILTLRLGDRTKTTRLYVDYPPELRALADSIDRKSGAWRWIEGGGPGGKAEEQ
jgi:hypothetical protein